MNGPATLSVRVRRTLRRSLSWMLSTVRLTGEHQRLNGMGLLATYFYSVNAQKHIPNVDPLGLVC